MIVVVQEKKVFVVETNKYPRRTNTCRSDVAACISAFCL
jgi:hypothetical protein